jgi:protein-tyrosine-phosphatase
MKEDQKQKILFLSAGASVRSIFAEYLIEKIAGERFNAYSGSICAPTIAGLLSSRSARRPQQIVG